MAVAVVIIGVTKKWAVGLLLGYCFFVLAVTILIRTPFEGLHFQPELFWSYKVWNVQREQIIANVIMFIPVGVLGGLIWRWKAVAFAAVFSVIIEVVQLVSRRGLFEFDDIIHNTLSAAIGLGL